MLHWWCHRIHRDVTDDKRIISQRCLNSKIVYPCSCAKARNEKLACPIHEFGKGYWTFYPKNGIPKFHKWGFLRKGLTPLWPTEGFKKNIQRWKKYVWKFCLLPIFPNMKWMLRAVFPFSWCWRWNFKLITIKLTTNQALSIDSSAKEREFLGLVFIFWCFSFS